MIKVPLFQLAKLMCSPRIGGGEPRTVFFRSFSLMIFKQLKFLFPSNVASVFSWEGFFKAKSM